MSDSLRPLNSSTPGLPVHHQLPEFTRTHVHRVGDAIQPSHPLSSPSPPCPQSLPTSESFPMSQLFTWGGQSTGVSALAYLLIITQRGWKLMTHETLYMMFTTALFIIVKMWEQPRCFSVDEWINTLGSIQTMEYYSVLKRKDLSNHEKNIEEPWMHITAWKKSLWKDYILYDSKYRTFWKL